MSGDQLIEISCDHTNSLKMAVRSGRILLASVIFSIFAIFMTDADAPKRRVSVLGSKTTYSL